MYIKLSALYPLDSTSIEASFGSWVHEAISSGITAMLSNTPFNIDSLLTFSANRISDSLIKQMISDKALFSEALRMVNNALKYVRTLTLSKEKNIMVEKKIEMSIRNLPITVVGVVDLAYGNTIIDWKTGTFTATEHHKQLQIYAFMMNKLGMMKPPFEIRDVYLGGSKPKVVKDVIGEKKLEEIEEFVYNLLKESQTSPKPRPSDACSMCPYKFRCPLYFRLDKENTIMDKVRRISQRLDHAYQYRKLSNELKLLATKIDTMATKLMEKHNTVRESIEGIPEDITEERVWTSGILTIIDQLTDEEKEKLLIALLKESATIKSKHLPESIKDKLFSFRHVDKEKIRKFM